MKISLITKIALLISITLSGIVPMEGQSNLPEKIEEKLEKLNLLISIPTEGKYKPKRVKATEFFKPDYAIRSKKKKIEILYSIINESDYNQFVPNIHATTTISNLAANEDARSLIAVHQMPEEIMLESFNADWAKVIYFQPKRSISLLDFGKLLCLYKSGKGMIYVLFLFNQGSEDEVEQQFEAVRFKE